MSGHLVRRMSRLAGMALALVAPVTAAHAQGWSAQFTLAPLPSPFLSDWELDPTIGQLVVTNPGAAATDVTFHYSVARNGKLILRGTTDPQTIPGQQSVVFTGASTFGGRADWDRDVQQTIARTGKLPEGEYEACVTVAGPNNIVLVERQCVRFTTQSADPPFLVSPANGDTVTSRDPIFEWLPVQVPPTGEARLGYVLQVAEVKTATGQRPEVALESNILHYVEPNLVQTSHQYPVGALPLVSGRMYAWRVQALDGDGKPAAANQGRSEIWTFVYRETETEVERKIARIELTPRRDTLRFAGDTARYEVTAYDADNVEITGKRVAWRSIDTTVVRVDSTGMVTGVGNGETRVVASIDGIADSALSVMALPTNLAIRFERYDAEKDKPSLLELVQSGSFEEVAPKLMELLRSGELVIPLPRLPGIERAFGTAAPDTGRLDFDSSMDHEGMADDGSVPLRAQVQRTVPPDCNDATFDVRGANVDAAKKIFLLYLPLNPAQRSQVTQCLGVPADDTGEIEEVERLRGALVVFSWSHPGFPRIFVIYKGIGIGLPLKGTVVDVRYIVFNLTAETKMSSELLPSNYGGFFGDVEFDAEVGLTYYAERSCPASALTPICIKLRGINPSNPVLTIKLFAGVKESETTLEFQREKTDERETKFKPQLGHSTAFGLEISVTNPVRVLQGVHIGDLRIDSLQTGLEFALEREYDSERGEKTKTEDKFAPTFKITGWLTRSFDNSSYKTHWQLNGDVGLEFEDDGADLVLALEVEQTWQLGPVRVGKPKVEVKVPLPPREKPDPVEVELSGSWGFGVVRNAPFGIADPDKDPFAEVGSAEVTMKWRTALTDSQVTKFKADTVNARLAIWNQEEVVQQRLTELKKDSLNSKAPDVTAATRLEALANVGLSELGYKESLAKLEKLKKDHKEVVDLLDPVCFPKTKTGLCISWSAKLGVDDVALRDGLSMVIRMITGWGNQ